MTKHCLQTWIALALLVSGPTARYAEDALSPEEAHRIGVEAVVWAACGPTSTA